MYFILNDTIIIMASSHSFVVASILSEHLHTGDSYQKLLPPQQL